MVLLLVTDVLRWEIHTLRSSQSSSASNPRIFASKNNPSKRILLPMVYTLELREAPMRRCQAQGPIRECPLPLRVLQPLNLATSLQEA